jgi:prepilin-type N-terminal cleavage/methylation domain-containing protein
MRRRGGFSLIELLIALTIVAVLGASLTRLMTSQMRYFNLMSAKKDTRAITRGSLLILQNELRMLETSGVDSATNLRLVLKVPYVFGVVCSNSTVSLLPVDSLIYASAIPGGYAWRDTATSGTYTYVNQTSAPSTGTTATCTGQSITTLTGGRVIAVSPTMASGAVVGAPFFLWQKVTYEFKASTSVSGATALWRTVNGGSADEIAVPFDTSAKFRFYVLDRDTSQVTVPGTLSQLRGIDLQLDSKAVRRVAGRSTTETAKVRASVFFRNRAL